MPLSSPLFTKSGLRGGVIDSETIFMKKLNVRLLILGKKTLELLSALGTRKPITILKLKLVRSSIKWL